MAGTEIARRSSGQQSSITFQGAQIVFRNFEGKEGQYNREGDRNFCLLLDPEVAEAMAADGWNIKFLKAREAGDEPQPYIQIAVSFGKGRPPKVVLLSSRGRTDLTEDEVDILDWMDIANVDLIIRPYEWTVNGKSGIKAYLKSIFVTMEEDELDLKYASVPQVGSESPLAIESGDIDTVEFIEDAEIVDGPVKVASTRADKKAIGR